ncbi:type III secretion system export apparatus subunit SctT [Noviherbaspirillum sp. CPCC 100848]|uniref:Type III secretion system export apparatus subunit SctT n=1 Tax=Noviherbaspirillum album TaxID=3080276 RepID=A0ABU6JC39_9BURK|nr:type III secretion system export apparatus subunit SctT [Noviherbaspirillum sp. CPCC 100848]MEC4720719.1 type III secretion system export apparatus subunit SctT [Noviherbaspirillum sp. CPCC 100848]
MKELHSTGAYQDAMSFIMALFYTMPRILAMFAVIPIFGRQQMPNLLRMAIASGLGVIVAPTLLAGMQAGMAPQGLALVGLVVKECFIGLVLGYLIAIPFWGFEAIGFIIDNQRGASIAATINPLTGHDSSPLGILFNQAFIVFFLIAGGFGLMLDILYNSYAQWSVFLWWPKIDQSVVPLLLAQLDGLVNMAVLLAAPAIIAMFLAEIGLALVSRFAPQLQVFFLAMPIKSGLAFLVLMLYTATLFEYGGEYLRGMKNVLPIATEWFR